MVIQLSPNEEDVLRTFQILGDETRYKICKLLLMSDQELCVSEIADRLQISASAVSQHFRMFEASGLVTKKRRGQKMCYQLETTHKIIKHLATVT